MSTSTSVATATASGSSASSYFLRSTLLVGALLYSEKPRIASYQEQYGIDRFLQEAVLTKEGQTIFNHITAPQIITNDPTTLSESYLRGVIERTAIKANYASDALYLTHALRTVGSAAEMYDYFRKGLGFKDAVGKGSGQLHHIVPLALIKDNKFVEDMIRNGWNPNSLVNGKYLNAPFHGNHPQYTKFVGELINIYVAKEGAEGLEEWVDKTLIPKLTKQIETAYKTWKDSGGSKDFNLNEQFRKAYEAIINNGTPAK